MALPRKICVGCRGSDQGDFDGGSVKEVVWEIGKEVIFVHVAQQGVDAIVPIDLKVFTHLCEGEIQGIDKTYRIFVDVEISDDVAPSGEDKDVLSSVAGERVVAFAAIKHVITSSSLENVFSNSTLQDVIALITDECVIAFFAIQMIISSSAIEEIALVVPVESVVLIFSKYTA